MLAKPVRCTWCERDWVWVREVRSTESYSKGDIDSVLYFDMLSFLPLLLLLLLLAQTSSLLLSSKVKLNFLLRLSIRGYWLFLPPSPPS